MRTRIKLYRPILGNCINLNNLGPVRIAHVDTQGHEALQGGKGIYEVLVETIPEYIKSAAGVSLTESLSDSELNRCKAVFDRLDEECKAKTPT